MTAPGVGPSFGNHTAHVVSFLGSSDSSGSSSTKWKQIAGDGKLHPENIQKLVGLYQEKSQVIQGYQKRLSEINRSLIHDADKLAAKKRTLTGWIVSKISDPIPGSSGAKIKQFFRNKSSAFRKELQAQEALKAKMIAGVDEKIAIQEKMPELMRELADAKIWALFKGEKTGFDNLDEFPVDDKISTSRYIDTIIPEKMTSPIMRGCDHTGREFFAIRGKFKYSDELHCQIFYRPFSKGMQWMSRGSLIVSNPSAPIYENPKLRKFADKKGQIDEQMYHTLQKIIQTGECEYFVLQ